MPRKEKAVPEARSHLWIVLGKEIIFGEGRVKILRTVQKHGSLNKAAKVLKMSYRAAWGKIRKTEEILGVSLMEAAKVHKHRGSRLTEEGEILLDAFEQFERESRLAVDSCFARTIGRLPLMQRLER